MAGAGIRVVSWDAMFRLERQQKLTPYQAAVQLGADGVLLLGTLETTDVRDCPWQGFRADFWQSGPAGHRGQPEALLPSAVRNLSTATLMGPPYRHKLGTTPHERSEC